MNKLGNFARISLATDSSRVIASGRSRNKGRQPDGFSAVSGVRRWLALCQWEKAVDTVTVALEG